MRKTQDLSIGMKVFLTTFCLFAIGSVVWGIHVVSEACNQPSTSKVSRNASCECNCKKCEDTIQRLQAENIMLRTQITIDGGYTFY